ncbi:MAG: hypothetical protein U0441_10735 [Polyangiaceae bacterium]
MTNLPPPDASKVLEARVQDSLSRFLELVADPASARPTEVADGSFLLCRFAESLGRVLMDGSLWTVWESKRHLFGAFLAGLGEPAASVASDAARALVSLKPGQILDQRVEAAVTITWIRKEDGAEAVRISSEAPRTTSLWLLRPPADAASASWRWFRSYLPGLKSHFVTVRALLQTRAAAEATVRRSKYEARVKQLGNERAKDFPHRMAEISDLLDEIADEDEIDCLDLTEDLAIATLQELMGTGWAVRQVGRLQNDRPSSPGLFLGPGVARPGLPGDGRPHESSLLAHALDRFEQVLTSRALDASTGSVAYDRERAERRRKLVEVSRCFRGLLDVPDVLPPSEGGRGEEALSLLPVWTRVHEACRALCRPRPAGREDYDKAIAVWGPAVEMTMRLLPRHLEVYPGIPGPDGAPESRRRGSPSARNWLSLWFTREVLRSIGTTPVLSDRESCSLHADLAFVLREGLRFACFGNRKDYFFQPSTYAAALRRLVEHHAHVVVGLPRDYNIVRLLEEIGEQESLNRFIAAEHLQHVLEVYIAGHFVLSVKIDVPDAQNVSALAAELHGQTIAEALTSGGPRRNAERASRIAQAYSLASLFHDVGHLLFPRDSIPHDSLDWDDPEIAAGLQKVGDSVNEAASEVAQKCFEDLGFAYYTKEELGRFKDELVGTTEPNHGLLGAWYLHRVGLGVLERSEDIDGFRESQSDILRMAVRAVLFHGAATGQIRSDVDPVSTMLIVCNEIFEWDPGRHAAPAPSSIGRSFHVMAADVPAREPRDAWIRIPSLLVRASETEGELDALLRVDPSKKTWPEIHVGLQVPQRLDVPVLRLWVAKAQSLGRLVATRHGLCPTVVMRSRIDLTLLSRGLTTKTLLDRVADRKSLSAIRPALRAWLALKDRFEEREIGDRSEESVRLGPLEQRLLFENLFEWLRRIEEEAWSVVQSIDADNDEPSSKRFWR